MKTTLSKALLLFCVLCAYTSTVIPLVRETTVGDNQWDFRTYYYSTKAYLQGENPYDDLVDATGKPLLPFLYSPLSIHLFTLFASLSYDVAQLVFLFIECCLLLYLIFIWHVAFLKEPVNPWFLLFCLLAFNSTVYLGLQAGNVCIIEQAALWTAFYFYMRNRLILFSIFLVMAAIFKWYPLFFGGLMVLCNNGRRFKAFASLGAVLLLAVFMTWIIDQRLFTQYVSAVQKIVRFTVVQGDDTFNLAAWPLIKAWTVMLGQDNWIGRPVVLQWFLFLLWAGIVTSLSWKAIRNLQLSEEEDLILAINVTCLVFALLSPRFQDYFYILLLVPAYFVMTRMTLKPVHLFFILCILSTAEECPLPWLNQHGRVFWRYYPLVLAVLVWLVYVIELPRRRTSLGSKSQF